MKIKTRELSGAALSHAVAQALGLRIESLEGGNVWVCEQDAFGADERSVVFNPYCIWAQGGPIIEKMMRQGLRLTGYTCLPTDPTSCQAQIGDVVTWGATPLIAAMRCFVSIELGYEVDVPEELIE